MTAPAKPEGASRRCLSCSQAPLTTVLDLGRTPLANALLTREQLAHPEPTAPLELALCPNCALVQITETTPPEVLFREYVYFSSFSDTMLEHCRRLVERLIADRQLSHQHLVVEIASNDGYLLQYYQRAGIPVLGIEPARNIAAVAANDRGIDTLCEFFTHALAQRLRHEGKHADVIHANNVLAHVPDLNGFVAGMKLLLKPGGLIVIEAPYLLDMLEKCEFDTIYHEHLCYFSLTALERLFSRHALTIFDVEKAPIHGGSLRLFVAHAGEKSSAESVSKLLAEEAARGIDGLDIYRSFAARVERLASDLRTLVLDLKQQGRRLAAYGASAKGSTLLNYLRLPVGTLEFVADRSTAKQGRFTPGTHLPIVAPVRLLEAQPDYVLLLTWNFKEEILHQQAEYRHRGGKFIVPVPEVQVE